MIFVTQEQERGCGYRQPGGLYLVSAKGVLGGGIPVEEDCEWFEPPIPVIGKPFRGFVYIAGDNLVQGVAVPVMDSQVAALWRYEWHKFGMSHTERALSGVCTGQFEIMHKELETIVDALKPIGELSRFNFYCHELVEEMRRLRAEHGDVRLIPAINVVYNLHRHSPQWTPAWDVLARAWQTIRSIRRVTIVPYSVREHCANIAKLCSAEADAGYMHQWNVPLPFLVADMLMCVGKEHYTKEEFITEAKARGVSKRLSTVPVAAVPGVSRVFLGYPENGGLSILGYTYMQQLQYIVEHRSDEPPEEVKKWGAVGVYVEYTDNKE